MRGNLRSTAALATLFALIFFLAPMPPSAAAGQGARLEGLVLGLDGRVAQGFRVHLIDADGAEVQQAMTQLDGTYSFAGLSAGTYGLGISNPSGQVAPVAGPPVRLGESELARRDLRLLEGDVNDLNRSIQGNYSVGSWWGNLGGAERGWFIAGSVIVLATIIVIATDDEDDDIPPTEPPSSKFAPL